MESKEETTMMGVYEGCSKGLGLYWGYIVTMESKEETTMMG